jgi:hypothetical protein
MDVNYTDPSNKKVTAVNFHPSGSIMLPAGINLRLFVVTILTPCFVNNIYKIEMNAEIYSLLLLILYVY